MTRQRTFPNSRTSRVAQRGRNCATAMLLAAFATVWLGGCATTRGRSSTLPDYVDDQHAQLTVASNYGHDVSVYLIAGASRSRLGNVQAFSTRVFRLPQYLNGVPLRVVLECRDSRTLHETREFSWERGQRIALALEPHLTLSRVIAP